MLSLQIVPIRILTNPATVGGASGFPLLVARLAKLKRVQLWRRVSSYEMEADLDRRISHIGEASFAPVDPLAEGVGRNGSAFFSGEPRQRSIGFRVD